MKNENTGKIRRRFFKDSPLEIRWILYDVGNSAFTLLASAIIPIYFSSIATSGGLTDADATSLWGYSASIVTLIVAILGPILGTFSDYRGFKRPLFFLAATLGILGCLSLSVPMPYVAFLVVYIFAKIFYSVSLIFYDSMLGDITTLEKADDISSKGYAFGYIGSCLPFLVSVALVVLSGLEAGITMPIAFGINALWWLGFTIPLFLSYRQRHSVPRRPKAVRDNFRRLFSVFSKKHNLVNRKGILLYLVAFFFYIDGVYTIIDMATSFGTALGFDSTQLLLALLVTQVIAFPAALVYGKLAKRIPNDLLIFIGILAYTGIAIFAIFMNQVWQFWLLACVVGLFQGGIQALSRSYFTKLIPPEKSGNYFGILDICGKGASFLGTLSVGAVSQITGNASLGVGILAVFFVIGLILFRRSVAVPEK